MFTSQAMSEAKIREDEALPKGRVTEVCQEWMVREDGALAYRLQNQEISEHLSGNKFRNAVVREDFPRAKSEQLREQQLAEHTAMIYHQMLAEQEEHDQMVAKQLADQIEREERHKRRALEVRDQNVVRDLLEKERAKVERLHTTPGTFSPQRPPPPRSYESYPPPQPLSHLANLTRRQAKPMPLPGVPPQNDLYTEPYRPRESLVDDFDRIDLADDAVQKQIQEEKDAELARQLQEQESSLENRDRLLAIEAQDKELAKLLQEQERSKARRARERAKQKALAKKQQQQLLENQQCTSGNQLMPDDSYSYPADLIPPRNSLGARHLAGVSDTYASPNQNEEDDTNYSLPVDVVSAPGLLENNSKSSYSQKRYSDKVIDIEIPNLRPSFTDQNQEFVPAVRPTQLDLRSPLNRINKPRYPEPESENTSPQHINIAMAIDPTYPRRGMHSPPSFDTSSSTVTTSTSSSSPGIMLPPPDVSELEDDDIAAPYMPIKGQRRTASLEKKQKKKSKEGGCKQQ